jgi:hypothetical protein
METKPQTPQDFFKTLRTIYLALLTGQVLFLLVSVYLVMMTGFDAGLQDLKDVFLILVPVFVAGGYLGGRMLFKNSMNTAKSRASLAEKLADYRSASIVRYALLEGPLMLSIIAYMITTEISFLVISIFIIAIFLTLMPGIAKVSADLELNSDEERQLRNTGL